MSNKLSQLEIADFLKLHSNWKVVGTKLSREYVFPDFASALSFTNKLGAIAESMNHHPDIHLSWGKVFVEIWTHSVNGISKLDLLFIEKVETA